MRIALVSREFAPFGGGGIGQFVSAAARLLNSEAEVVILTSSRHEAAYRELLAAGDRRLPPAGVRIEFIAEPAPGEAAGYFCHMHLYSGRILDRLRAIYADGGPDIIEFGDYLGEGLVTLQAAHAGEPFLADTRVCVRMHTSGEMCKLLDGHFPLDFASRATDAMERFTLARADRVIWQGGDILGTYQRFYGSERLAPDVRIRYPFHGATCPAGADAKHPVDGPLRLLYFGRMERRKGVHNLVRAMTAQYDEDWRLTLIGGDTPTAPLGRSMRDLLTLAVAGDERIDLREGVDREELAKTIVQHDVIVLPSLWECWPYTALEALHLNRPVLATQTGGYVEMIQPGVNGWLASGTDAHAMSDAAEHVLKQRTALPEMLREHRPRHSAERLTEPQGILDGYQALATAPASRIGTRRPKGAATPLVSVVIPYFRASEFVRDTVTSLMQQTHPRLEIILVNDGSFLHEDWIVAELSSAYPIRVVTQPNSGLGAARNLGVALGRGRYFLPLDADNMVEPTFVARCVEMLEREPGIAYVTSWTRYVDEHGEPRPGDVDIGYQPFGNHHEITAEHNTAGDAVAVVRQRLFDLGHRYSEELTSFEDWCFYRNLQQAGHPGAVIPERLIRYRVREDSMLKSIGAVNRTRLDAEMEAVLREDAVQWTSSSA